MEPDSAGFGRIIPLSYSGLAAKMDDRNTLEHSVHADSAGSDEEQLLWLRLKAGDETAREQLAQRHLPHAHRVAATYYRRRLHNEIEFDDYLQLAILGMMESLDRFDSSIGIQFRTFSSRRMHGTILDGLERMTEKQQQIAARRRAQKERIDSLVASPSSLGHGLPPISDNDSSQTAALFRYLAEVGVGLALSFMLDGTGMYDQGEANIRSHPDGDATYYRRAELCQLRAKLLAHIDDLKPQARHVIRCHYVQEVPFADIAESMGLTKGRVSQIHREALLWLRNELRVERSSDLIC